MIEHETHPRLPSAASDDIREFIAGDAPCKNEAYIMNLYPGKELLTRVEALDTIAMISTMLLADERHRGG